MHRGTPESAPLDPAPEHRGILPALSGGGYSSEALAFAAALQEDASREFGTHEFSEEDEIDDEGAFPEDESICRAEAPPPP